MVNSTSSVRPLEEANVMSTLDPSRCASAGSASSTAASASFQTASGGSHVFQSRVDDGHRALSGLLVLVSVVGEQGLFLGGGIRRLRGW